MDNPEILETVRENRRDNQEWTIQRNWQQLEKTDGAKKSVTVREKRRGNKEWTIQIHCQHLVRKTQDEDKQYIYIYIYKKNRHTQKKE